MNGRWNFTVRLPFVACIAVLAGCAMHLRPPANPREPTAVYVVDYGLHCGLLLPSDAAYVEFSYGEWNWFALNHQQWYRVFRLLFPGPGALAMRTAPDPAVVPDAAHFLGAECMHALYVERTNAEKLRQSLLARYERHRATEIYNPSVQMTLVREPTGYTLFNNNCNRVLAGWLEELGCRITGTRIEADFIIELPRARPEPRAP